MINSSDLRWNLNVYHNHSSNSKLFMEGCIMLFQIMCKLNVWNNNISLLWQVLQCWLPLCISSALWQPLLSAQRSDNTPFSQQNVRSQQTLTLSFKYIYIYFICANRSVFIDVFQHRTFSFHIYHNIPSLKHVETPSACALIISGLSMSSQSRYKSEINLK